MPDSLKISLENSKAEYVQLGKSGLRVSIPIFGAMRYEIGLSRMQIRSWCHAILYSIHLFLHPSPFLLNRQMLTPYSHSFGSSQWAPWVIEEEEALPLLKAAYDRGLNTWGMQLTFLLPNSVMRTGMQFLVSAFLLLKFPHQAHSNFLNSNRHGQCLQ